VLAPERRGIGGRLGWGLGYTIPVTLSTYFPHTGDPL
jgi:hypothetical protein